MNRQGAQLLLRIDRPFTARPVSAGKLSDDDIEGRKTRSIRDLSIVRGFFSNMMPTFSDFVWFLPLDRQSCSAWQRNNVHTVLWWMCMPVSTTFQRERMSSRHVSAVCIQVEGLCLFCGPS